MDSDSSGPDVPLHFTAFHPDFKLQDKPRTPAKTLDHARQIALDVGLRYVYEGNIYSEVRTHIVRSARKLLIRRSWHDVLENRIKDGACLKCGFTIPGVGRTMQGSNWPKQGVAGSREGLRPFESVSPASHRGWK